MGEREINIQDLLVEILLHWRGIIFWMFVGGIVSGIFSYVGFMQSARIQREQQEKSDISGLQREMSQKELAEVEQVLLNEESIKKWNSYIENSVLMSLDSSQVYQGDLIYAVRADGMQTDLTGIYVNLLTTNEMYQYVADRMSGVTASDIQDLISVVNIGTALNQKNSSFNITVLAGSEENCTSIAEAVKSYIGEINVSITSTYGEHDIVLLQDNITDTDSISLLQKQIDMRGSVISLQTETARLRDAFSEKQRQYYQAWISEMGIEEESLGKGIEDTGTKVPSSLEEGAKDIMWGIFFVVLIYVTVIFFWFILDDRLRYTDNCTDIYHVPALGHIPAKRGSRSPFKRIDRRLYMLRDKRRYTSSVKEAVRLSVGAIKIASQGKGTNSICGVGGSEVSEAMERIRKGLSADNIEVLTVGNILYSADSMSLLEDVQAAFLVERAGAVSYSEILQKLEILRLKKIDILGMVIVE